MKAHQDLIRLLTGVGFVSEGWRFEDKFLIPINSAENFAIIAREKLPHLVENFSARQVNSIYFEYPTNELLRQSIDGDQYKVKIRFRWYGDPVTPVDGRLEVKMKAGAKGIKLRSPIVKFSEIKSDLFRSVRNRLPNFDWLKPKVLVSYSRRYYQSLLQNTRLTLDREISACEVIEGLWGRNPLPITQDLVCELKEPIENQDQSYYQPITIPLRKIKFSKYDQACKFLGL